MYSDIETQWLTEERVAVPHHELEEVGPEIEAPLATGEEPQEEVETPVEEAEGPHDPVVAYLREIGSVSLLSREREVELGQQMQTCRKEILEALFSTPMAIRYVLELGTALADGELDLRQIIERLEGDEEEREEALDPRPFLKAVAKLRRSGAKEEEVSRQLTRTRLSKPLQAQLERKKAHRTQKVCELITGLNLSPSHIDGMIQSLKRSADRVALIEQQLSVSPQQNQPALHGQIREIIKSASRRTR